MGFFDLFKRRRSAPPQEPSEVGGIGGGPPSTGPAFPPGDGGPSFFADDLAALRWAAQHEAVNVGRMPIDPEEWPGGRLSFEFERALAHEHEGIRDRLSNFVGATSKAIIGDLYLKAYEITHLRDQLSTADRELAVALDSWNRLYREVHEDELEQGRYVRMNSTPYKIIKYLIAALMIGAEWAVSVALFQRLTTADNALIPVLFAAGLILVFVVVPHYVAINLKEGVTKYHDPELQGYLDEGRPVPSKIIKKVSLEKVEDRGIWIAATLAGLALIGLMIPASVLRAEEFAGDGGHLRLWFFFFLLLQFAISSYFFLREWHDHGTAAASLLHHDQSKLLAEKKRKLVLDQYALEVAEFHAIAQHLYGLFREAPRWDSHIVQSHLATVHYFRHIVALEHPDLAFFIANATVPHLGGLADTETGAEHGFDLRSVRAEHPALEGPGNYGREWWIDQLGGALTAERAASERPAVAGAASPGSVASGLVTLGPADILVEFLRFFGIYSPYERPTVFDYIEEVDDDIEVHHTSRPSPQDPSVFGFPQAHE